MLVSLLFVSGAHATPFCGMQLPLATTSRVVSCVGCSADPVPHYAVRPTFDLQPFCVVPSREFQSKLVVYLTGGGGEPDDSTKVVTTAAKLGFRAIGLSYDNQNAVHEPDVCGMMTVEADAADCYEEIYDDHVWGNSAVLPGDSVDGRLTSALTTLSAVDPCGGWGTFLSGGEVRYEEVIVIGWSFGAALVADLGRTTTIQAGLMIDGVKDRYQPMMGVNEPALMDPTWDPVTGIGTHGCRFWGLYDSTQNEVDMLREQFTAIGMLEVTSFDGESVDGAPTSTIGVADVGDRRFYTTPAACNTNPHESFTVDAKMLLNITTCTPAGVHYQLDELYQSFLCQASATTCTN